MCLIQTLSRRIDKRTIKIPFPPGMLALVSLFDMVNASRSMSETESCKLSSHRCVSDPVLSQLDSSEYELDTEKK